MKSDAAASLEDQRLLARRRLPRLVFDVIDGGADDELSLAQNRSGFDQIRFRPQPFANVSPRNLATTVLNENISLPVMLAPTGSARLAFPEGELAIARVAGEQRTIYAHSTVAGYSPEDVARAGTGPLWFQLFLPADRNFAAGFIDRIEEAGYRALLLTVDTAVRGNRERDVRNGFSLPYKVTPRLVAQGLSRPGWSTKFVMSNLGLARAATYDRPKPTPLREVEAQLVDPQWPVTWADLAFVRDRWNGPLLVKGIMRPDECERLIECGVDGIVVSNHGGRQLDGVPSTISVLPSIVEAVAGRAEVYLDGGVRRGTDVLKALALGARACFVGRPYIYALAAGGEKGLHRMFDLLRAEIDRSMALLGCRSIEDLDRSFVEVLARGPDRCR